MAGHIKETPRSRITVLSSLNVNIHGLAGIKVGGGGGGGRSFARSYPFLQAMEEGKDEEAKTRNLVTGISNEIWWEGIPSSSC